MPVKYIIGFTGVGLWILSWGFGLLIANRTGGLLMLIVGGLGYVLIFISVFLPETWRKK